jgi:hypothetical protein
VLQHVKPARAVVNALEVLRATGLDSGPELGLLEREIAQNMERLDRKVHRVVVDGAVRWRG